MNQPDSPADINIATASTTSTLRRWWMPLSVLAITAGVVLFYKLGDCRSFGSHEVFPAVPAREMLRSDNWVVPRFGGVPRLEKPPLAYWVVAASAQLFGELSEWTARFPAAASAFLLAVLMGVWAGRWYGIVAGLAATLVQLTSVYALIFARKAEVDMLMCLLTTSAMFLIAQQKENESHRRAFFRWIGIYALVSLSWMAKFHYGPTMVLAPAFAYFVIQRQYRSLVHMANPVGLAIFAAAILVWPYLLLQQVPEALAVWRGETVGRALGELGQRPFWFYVPQILWLILPWTPLALAALPKSWRLAWCSGTAREQYFGVPSLWKTGNARERFLWIWFLTVLAIVTVSANKHKHYIFAALPVFSLWAGQQMSLLYTRYRRGEPLIPPRWAVALMFTCVGVGVGAWLVVGQKWPTLSGPILFVSLVVGVGGSVAALLSATRYSAATGYAAIAVFLGCYVGVMGGILPGRDHRLSAVKFAQQVRAELTTETPVGVYRMGMDPTVFYLGDPVYRITSPEDVAERLRDQQKLMMVTFKPRLSEMPRFSQYRIIRQLSPIPGVPAPKQDPLVLVELSMLPSLADETGRNASSGLSSKIPPTGRIADHAIRDSSDSPKSR